MDVELETFLVPRFSVGDLHLCGKRRAVESKGDIFSVSLVTLKAML